ncbi:MAG: hypothetical protein ACREV8_07660, partial [Gammaproteobacteria bacterium]
IILTAAGPIPVEDGIEIEFSTDPAGGSFRAGDYWLIWARTATAQIDEFTAVPPRGILHHYMQIAAINGLSGATEPAITDCRPPPQQRGDCCCTIIVRPGESIQAGIDALPAQGGCVCLKTGTHVIREPLRIARGSVALTAESPGTVVRSNGLGPVLIIGNPAGAQIEGVDVLGIDFEGNETSQPQVGTGPPPPGGEAIIVVVGSRRVRIAQCEMSSQSSQNFIGLLADTSDHINVYGCRFRQLALGILARNRCEQFEADSNIIELDGRGRTVAVAGIAVITSAFPCRITRNLVSGAMFGIVLNDDPFGTPRSIAYRSIVADIIVESATLP